MATVSSLYATSETTYAADDGVCRTTNGASVEFATAEEVGTKRD